MDSSKRKCRTYIGIEGAWYNVTNYLSRHPGGDIIRQFANQDATAVFRAFHKSELKILKHWHPVGSYNLNGLFSKIPNSGNTTNNTGKSTPFDVNNNDCKPSQKCIDTCTSNDEIQKRNERIAEEFIRLDELFKSLGYYEPSYSWLIERCLFSVCFLITSLMLMKCFPPTSFSTPWTTCLSAFALSQFWSQCGYLMHDACHTSLHKDRRISSYLGTLFGTLCFGVNGTTWQREHFAHHALVNTVDYNPMFIDPQAANGPWAQNQKMFPLFNDWISRLIIRVQHLTFLPLNILVGRPAITIASMIQDRTMREWVGFTFHLLGFIYLYQGYFDGIPQLAAFYFFAGCFDGILHLQLLANHMVRPFTYKWELDGGKITWYEMQVVNNSNMDNWPFMDWFYGGLNLHIEHHLFPRLCRRHYRAASVEVKASCDKLGLPYLEYGFAQLVWLTIKHLKEMGDKYEVWRGEAHGIK